MFLLEQTDTIHPLFSKSVNEIKFPTKGVCFLEGLLQLLVEQLRGTVRLVIKPGIAADGAEQPPECVCLDTRKAAWLQAPPEPSPPAFGFASGSTSWMPRAVATGAQHRASELPADV